MPYRTERAGSFIQEELTELLMESIKDPRVAAVTITGVDVTRDRRLARVYVSCYSGEEDLKEGLAGLESAKGFLRRALGQTLHWPFTPYLEFRADRSWEYGSKIDALLDEIHKEDCGLPEPPSAPETSQETDE